MLDILKSHYKRFSKFATVGVVNTVVDFSVFSLLTFGFGFYYIFAHICGFVLANINSFFINSRWTFRTFREDAAFRQFRIFFLISLCGLGMSTMTLYLCVGLFSFILPGLWLPHVWSKVIASGVSMLWNYIGSWLFVFKPSSRNPSSP